MLGVGTPYEVGAHSYGKSWIRHCLAFHWLSICKNTFRQRVFPRSRRPLFLCTLYLTHCKTLIPKRFTFLNNQPTVHLCKYLCQRDNPPFSVSGQCDSQTCLHLPLQFSRSRCNSLRLLPGWHYRPVAAQPRLQPYSPKPTIFGVCRTSM